MTLRNTSGQDDKAWRGSTAQNTQRFGSEERSQAADTADTPSTACTSIATAVEDAYRLLAAVPTPSTNDDNPAFSLIMPVRSRHSIPRGDSAFSLAGSMTPPSEAPVSADCSGVATPVGSLAPSATGTLRSNGTVRSVRTGAQVLQLLMPDAGNASTSPGTRRHTVFDKPSTLEY